MGTSQAKRSICHKSSQDKCRHQWYRPPEATANTYTQSLAINLPSGCRRIRVQGTVTVLKAVIVFYCNHTEDQLWLDHVYMSIYTHACLYISIYAHADIHTHRYQNHQIFIITKTNTNTEIFLNIYRLSIMQSRTHPNFKECQTSSLSVCSCEVQQNLWARFFFLIGIFPPSPCFPAPKLLLR